MVVGRPIIPHEKIHHHRKELDIRDVVFPGGHTVVNVMLGKQVEIRIGVVVIGFEGIKKVRDTIYVT